MILKEILQGLVTGKGEQYSHTATKNEHENVSGVGEGGGWWIQIAHVVVLLFMPGVVRLKLELFYMYRCGLGHLKPANILLVLTTWLITLACLT